MIDAGQQSSGAWCRIPNAALPLLGKAGGAAALVYLALAARANAEGSCWPSIRTIGDDTQLSDRSVQYAIGKLSDAGLLTCDARQGRATLYRLTRATDCIPSDGGGATACTTPLQSIAGAPATCCTPPLQPVAPRTRTKNKNQEQHSENKTAGKPAQVPIPAVLDNDEFRAAWAEWIAYRKQRRSTLTVATQKAQLAKLEAMGTAGAVRSIRRSIEHGWQGLFDPKENANGCNGQGRIPIGPGQRFDPTAGPATF